MADSKRVRISKREGALMARLSAKEQEVYEVQASARDLYRARRPVTDFARQVYTDPAINVEFQLMTAQLGEMENSLRLKEAELKELRASVDKGKGSEAKGAAKAAGTAANGGDGKAGAGGESKAARASALVSRCQRLEQENEELAASADVAKVAQLTSEKAVAEAYAGELKTALEEAYEYIEQLEEEREVNSNKVYALEEELRSVAAQPYSQESYLEAEQSAQAMHQMQSEETVGESVSWGQPQEIEEMHEADGDIGDGVGTGEATVDDDAPPPPPEDMEDLYGDIGDGGAREADGIEESGAGVDVKEDPMEEEDEQEEEKKEEKPVPTRARSTRVTRSRK